MTRMEYFPGGAPDEFMPGEVPIDPLEDYPDFADPLEPSVEEIVEDRYAASALRSVMAALPVRERKVILLRNGFIDEPQTQSAIAKELGVGTERVRQLELRAMGRLRASALINELGVSRQPDFSGSWTKLRRKATEAKDKTFIYEHRTSTWEVWQLREALYEVELCHFVLGRVGNQVERWPQAFDTKIIRDAIFNMVPQADLARQLKLIVEMNIDSLETREELECTKYNEWLASKITRAAQNLGLAVAEAD